MENFALRCRIANLKVLITALTENNRLIPQSRDYLCDFSEEPDIKIKFTMDFLKNRIAEMPNLPLSECEYIWTGFDFSKKLLDFNGFVLHASAVCYKERAYLFSAPSGTGKSTHASIWQKVFGEEAIIINDDKPALRLIDGKIYVFGTPWSGKSNKNKNTCVPLGGICFISRSHDNKITKADRKSAVNLLISQTLRYPNRNYMESLLDFIDKNLSDIPVFQMGCNMEDEAARVAYEYMSENLKGPDFYEN